MLVRSIHIYHVKNYAELLMLLLFMSFKLTTVINISNKILKMTTTYIPPPKLVIEWHYILMFARPFNVWPNRRQLDSHIGFFTQSEVTTFWSKYIKKKSKLRKVKIFTELFQIFVAILLWKYSKIQRVFP